MGVGCSPKQLGPDTSEPLWYALPQPSLRPCASYFLTLATATSSAAIPRENESNAFLSQFEGMLQSTSVGDGPGHASDGAPVP